MKSLFAGAVVAVASTAFAERPALTADVGAVTTVVTDHAYDFVDVQDHLGSFHVAFGAGLAVARGTLDVEGALDSGGASSTVHTSLAVNLWLRGAELGLRYRLAVKPWLEPYLRLGAGWSWATLTVMNEARLTQTVGHPGGSAVVGVQLPVPVGNKGSSSPTLVFDLGIGWALRPGYRFDALGPKPPEKNPEDPIATAKVDLGTLPLPGLLWRASVAMRF